MKEEKSNADLIREIVERINSSDQNGASNADGMVFTQTEKPTGMVFETMGDEAESPSEKTEEPIPAAKPAVPEEPKKEEFSVPETFEVSERYNAPLREEQPPRIYTTYMPNFSGASDRYRMVNDPRPQKKAEVKTSAAPKIEAVSVSAATDEVDGAPSVADAVEVNTSGTPEKEEPAFNVFKFAEDGDRVKEAVPPQDEEERERDEIHKLLKSEPKAETPFDSVPAKTPEEPLETPKEKEQSSSGVRVYDYPPTSFGAHQSGETLLPEGASEHPQEGKKSDRTEFLSSFSRDAFKDRFLDRLLSQKVRLFVALTVALFALIFENLWVFGTDPVTLFRLSSRAGTDLLIDLQFAFCMALLVLPEILGAVRLAVHKKLTPEILLPVGLLSLVIYCLICFGKAVTGAPMFAFLYAVSSVATVWASFLRTKADFLAFRIVATGAEKRVVDKKLTRTLEKENLALDGAVNEAKSRTARVFRTPFVSDFMKRSSKCTEDGRLILRTFGVAFGVALVAGAVVFFVASPIRGLAVFSMTFLLSVPSFGFLLHKLPFCHVETVCAGKMSTAIGETSLLDYAGVDVMTYEDTEIFGKTDVNFKRIMLYGERDNLPKAMKQMASLYLVVGGPLRSLFAFALDRKPMPAEGVRIEEDGIYGTTDGHRIDSGSLSYMIRKGYAIPDEEENEKTSYADSTRILYAAEDGRIYAKFLIRYSFSENFTSLLPILKENGITALVYTCDPCIQKELLSTLTGGQTAVRVMKRTAPISDSERVYRRISAGLVTLGDKTDALTLILLSKEYTAVQERLSKIALIFSAIGAAAAVPLAILGIPSLYPALWQIAGCLLLYFVSKKHFLPKNTPVSNQSEDTVKEQHVVLR